LTNTINSHAASKAQHTSQEIHAGLLRVARFRADHPQTEDLSETGRVRIIGGVIAKFLADLALAHPLLALLLAEGTVHACGSSIIFTLNTD